MTTTTTAKKTATSKKAAAPKATPKATTAKATAKKSTPAPAPKVKKSDVPEHLRDYTYLADKEPTALHDDFANWLIEVCGLEFDDMDQENAFLKGVQTAAVLRGVYQRSPRNKQRAEYRPLDEAIVTQRSTHMVQAHVDARQAIEARNAQPAKKATPRRRAAKKA